MIDLIFGDEVGDWVACLAFFFFLPPFLFLNPSFLLALILLWSGFRFCLGMCVCRPRAIERRRENFCFACAFLFLVFSFSLFFLCLGRTKMAKGGRSGREIEIGEREKWFCLFYCFWWRLLARMDKGHHFLSRWFCKNHAPTMVSLSGIANLQNSQYFWLQNSLQKLSLGRPTQDQVGPTWFIFNYLV